MLELPLFAFRLAIFVVVNGLIAYGAWRTARTLTHGALTRTEVLAVAIVLATTQIVLTQILLGLLGLLFWWLALALNGMLSIALIWLNDRSPHSADRPDGVVEGSPRDRIAWGVALAVGIILLIHLPKVLGAPPFGTDSLLYHLPFAVEWLQSGAIHGPNFSSIPYAYYPGTSELIDLWLMLPFHETVLVNFQNWPFVALAALSLYSLGRRVGLPARWAIYGSLFFVGLRAVQLPIAFVGYQDNDILFAAFFLTGVNLSIAAAHSGHRSLTIVEGLALGLLIGTKFSGPAYAGLVVIVHIVLLVAQKRGGRLPKDLALVAATAALAGGFWYVRNWITIGNPIPPNAIKLAGIVVFPGREDRFFLQESSLLANVNNPNAVRLFIDRVLLDHGSLAAVLTIPAMLVATSLWGYALVQRRRWPLLTTMLYVALPWAAFGLLWISPWGASSVPGTLDQLEFGYTPARYGFPLWGLVSLLLAKWLSDQKVWRSSWAPDALAVFAVLHSWLTLLPYQHEFTTPALSQNDVVTWLGVVAGVFVLERMWRSEPRRAWRWPATALAVTLIALQMLWPRYEGSSSARTDLYDFKFPASTVIRQQVKALGVEQISIVGSLGYGFALYDEGLTTRVIYCPRRPEQWIACIRDREVQLVAFLPDTQVAATGLLTESLALQSFPDQLSLVLSADQVHLYRVQP